MSAYHRPGLVMFSIDGGETWDMQGTFGSSITSTAMSQLRQALQARYGSRVRMRWVPEDDFRAWTEHRAWSPHYRRWWTRP